MVGLYRDDGLAVSNLPGPDLDRLRKEVVRMFSSFNLKITVETGMKVTDFLDVSLNLQNNIYMPYRKDSNHIHTESLQPPPSHHQTAAQHDWKADLLYFNQ